MTAKRYLFAFPLMLAGMPASAHTGVHLAPGLADGFIHPFGGIDHVLAMLTVGLLAALLGGRAIWAVPASFVAMMVMGAALGIGGVEIPAVEAGIATSVVVLGAVVAWGRSCLIAVAMALVGVFAVFHGFAHGAEMQAGYAAFYSLGFAIATAVLHGAGLMLGLGALENRLAIRWAGALVSVAGLAMAFG